MTHTGEGNWKGTYIERPLKEDPPRFLLDVEVVEVITLKGSREAVPNGSVVVCVFIGGRNSEDVGPDVGVLLHILYVLLSVEQGRIVVNIRDLHSEGADSLQTRLARVDCFHRHRDSLAVITFTVKHLVRKQFTGFLINSELCALLVWLLHYRVLHLAIDTFVLIKGMHLDHRTSVWCTFLNLGSIRCTILEHRLVVIDVGYEDDNHSSGSMDVVWINRSSGVDAALAIVHRGHVQLVLVPVQVDLAIDESDHAGVRLNSEQAGSCSAANKSECNSITVLEKNIKSKECCQVTF